MAEPTTAHETKDLNQIGAKLASIVTRLGDTLTEFDAQVAKSKAREVLEKEIAELAKEAAWLQSYGKPARLPGENEVQYRARVAANPRRANETDAQYSERLEREGASEPLTAAEKRAAHVPTPAERREAAAAETRRTAR
jgi:hypothetical protein